MGIRPEPWLIRPPEKHVHSFPATHGSTPALREPETLARCEGCRHWLVWAEVEAGGRSGFDWLPIRWWHYGRKGRIAAATNPNRGRR